MKSCGRQPEAQVLVRAVKFKRAQWHISQPTPVADFGWTDLTAEGETDMGKALELVAEQLKMPPMSAVPCHPCSC